MQKNVFGQVVEFLAHKNFGPTRKGESTAAILEFEREFNILRRIAGI